jgi:hypothetical protein
MPDDFHYLADQPDQSDIPQALENHTESPTVPSLLGTPTMLSQYMELSAHDHRLVRVGLIVWATIVITFIILWWLLSHGNFPDIVPGKC